MAAVADDDTAFEQTVVISRYRRRNRWPLIAVLIAVPVLILARLWVAGFTFDQVWAEDGGVFLFDAEVHGVRSLGYVYAGYLHVVPRGLTLLGTALPLAHFDLFALVASVVVVTLLAGFVYAGTVRLTGSPGWPALPALGMALVPAAAQESLANLANLQWWFLPAAFVALALPLARGAGRSLQVVAAVVALAAALTTPLTVFVLPVAVVRGWRGLLSLPVLGLLAGLAVQAVGIAWAPTSALVYSRNISFDRPWVSPFLSGVLGPFAGPERLAVGVGILVAIGGALLAWRARTGRRLALAATVAAVADFLTTAVLTGPLPRYLGAAALLMALALAALLPSVPRAFPIAAALAGALALASFPITPYRATGPGWTAGARAGEQACEDGAPRLVVLVAPPGWVAERVVLPCPGDP